MGIDVGVLAPDGIIYWTEGNIGLNMKELHVGMVVDVFYKKVAKVKYPVVTWVEKHMPTEEPQEPQEPQVEQIVLSKTDFDLMIDAVENPPEPNDALKDLLKEEDE